MKGYSTKQILDPWFDMPDNYDELEKVYRTLAKSADQRLVRLERYADEQGFETAKEWAYARAMHDIKQWSGDEADRFNVKPPASKTDLLSKIQDIKTFLESKTSTKAGIITVYKKKADSLNKTMHAEYGDDWTDVTWKDMSQYFDSALYDKIDKSYGSKTKMLVMSAIKKKKKEIAEDIKAKKDIHVKLDDEEAEIKINDILNAYPKQVKALLKENK